jgi:hypothetical protein
MLCLMLDDCGMPQAWALSCYCAATSYTSISFYSLSRPSLKDIAFTLSSSSTIPFIILATKAYYTQTHSSTGQADHPYNKLPPVPIVARHERGAYGPDPV